MQLERYSLPLTIAALLTLAAASMLIWLVVYEPVALAGAVDRGDASLVAEAVGRALLTGLKALIRYL